MSYNVSQSVVHNESFEGNHTLSNLKNSFSMPMVEAIKAMIVSGKYPAGSKIPPVRQLSKDFNISVGTATRGINFLVENGILEARRGSGTFVRKLTAVRTSRSREEEIKIAVFMVSSNLSQYYCAHALLGVQDAIKNCNCTIQVRFCEHQELTYAMMENAAADNDGLLLLSDYDRAINDIPHNVPTVGMEMHRSFNQINSTVTIDPVDAAELAVGFFRERKLKHVKIFSHDGPLHRTRATLFQSEWSRYGSYEIVELALHEEESALVDCGDPAIGYLFTGGSAAQGSAYRYAGATGRILAADYHVLSIDGKSLTVPNYQPMNTIGISWYEAGIVALEECLRRVRNPGSLARRIYLAGQLYSYNRIVKSRRE